MKNEPWKTEPDMLKWTDPATGLQCLILRGPYHMGHLCGYVRLPHGAPMLRGNKPNRRRNWFLSLRVHGGVTFDGKRHRPTGGTYAGKWIGFDCAHAWDYVPGMVEAMPSLAAVFDRDATYRDMAFVKAQCESLAAQIAHKAGVKA